MRLKSKKEPAQLSDGQLFDYIYKRYHKKIFEYAHFYCGIRENSEDVVQDVFLRLWQEMQTLRPKIESWYNWRSFLFVMTRNKAQNSRRVKAKEEKARAVYSTRIDILVYDDALAGKEHDQVFYNAVNKLSCQQKIIFVLKYYRFKTKIIARELNLKPKTVSNTLITCKGKLADQVYKEFEINESLVKLANESKVWP
jgi:RNA polymerase sigma-70 factor (ECF subfamily)